MAIKLPSHLHRNRHGVLYFRLTIPSDLRSYFKPREIYRSLGTAHIRLAADHGTVLALEFRRLFTRLRDAIMNNKKHRIREALESDKAIQVGYILEVDLGNDHKPTKIRIDAQPHEQEAVNTALQTLFSAQPAADRVRTQKSGKNISEYVEPYLVSMPIEQRPNAKTLNSYQAAINTFIKIVGDKPLNELSVQDQNRFEDVIVNLPLNSTKLESTRSVSIDQMLLLKMPSISVQNAKNIARRANVFLTWAFRREGATPPFELLGSLKLTKKTKSVKKRRAFSDEELAILFNPATYAQSNQYSPYMFWLPLIGLHTGMRINEIAQLELSDINEYDRILCFNVTDLPDPNEEAELIAPSKRVKTDAGKRLVPVHHKLKELGLTDYIAMLRSAGHSRLFPDLTSGRDGPGQPASKHFGRYCDKVGLKNPELVFHSFRHGAVGRMRSAKVEKELRKAVVGHSLLEDTHDGYGDINNDHSVGSKYEAVEALNFILCLAYDALRQIAPTAGHIKAAIRRNSLRQKSGGAMLETTPISIPLEKLSRNELEL